MALTAEEEVELLELEEVDSGGESLSNFIRRMSPHHPPPPHLKPLIDLIERARREVVRAVISFPPRHAKTTTIQHGLAWWLTQSPADTHAYMSYSDTQALSKSGPTRELALRAGVELRTDSTSKAEWRTTDGGGLLAGGVGGGLTGQGVSGLLVIDDPIKNREEADSEIQRESVWGWFTDVAMTRLEGASVLVVMTRWHKDDLIGRLIEQGGWEVLNLTAIAEVEDPAHGFPADPLGRAPGEALWPEQYPVEQCASRTCAHSGHLSSIRKTNEYTFAAMYQGRPRPRGATVFGSPTYYDHTTFSITGKQIVIYADPAATKKTSNDFSSIMAMAIEGREPHTRKGWILEVYRKQVTVPTFMDDLRAFQARWGNTVANVEAVGMARAIPDMLELVDPGGVEGDTDPQGDKFTRAQPVAAAWNDPDGGRVLVPISAPWLKEYLREMEDFTGVNDAHDDQVDVTSGCWNSYEPKVIYSGQGAVVAKRRM
jgi:predicted phage terminase large subunit-like protein